MRSEEKNKLNSKMKSLREKSLNYVMSECLKLLRILLSFTDNECISLDVDDYLFRLLLAHKLAYFYSLGESLKLDCNFLSIRNLISFDSALKRLESKI